MGHTASHTAKPYTMHQPAQATHQLQAGAGAVTASQPAARFRSADDKSRDNSNCYRCAAATHFCAHRRARMGCGASSSSGGGRRRLTNAEDIEELASSPTIWVGNIPSGFGHINSLGIAVVRPLTESELVAGKPPQLSAATVSRNASERRYRACLLASIYLRSRLTCMSICSLQRIWGSDLGRAAQEGRGV
jgi:hypothetical protein